jgi:hypothetical protein
VNDRASDPSNERGPRPGDASVCIGCGGLGVFDKRLRLRQLRPGELQQIMAHPVLGPLAKRLQTAARSIPDEARGS